MDPKLFRGLGIGEKPAKIYIAGLSLGTTNVQELARKSGLKRPTVYLHVDELMKQGLFETVVLNKKRYYRAVGPEILEGRLKKNLEILRAEVPKLLEMQADTMGRPQVQMFEGKEGVAQMYGEIEKARSIRVWSNIGPIAEPFHDVYMDMAENMRERATNIREIIADTKKSRRYSRLLARVIGPSYSARTATVDGIENDTLIYDNTVAIFRLHGLNMFVVRIEDPTIADSMRAVFEMAWKTARPFK